MKFIKVKYSNKSTKFYSIICLINLKDENIDEKITEQQSQIEKQVSNFKIFTYFSQWLFCWIKIAEEQALVSKKFDLNDLLKEYLPEDIIYRKKIEVSIRN